MDFQAQAKMQVLSLLLIGFLGGVVRGYAGFGSSMFWVGGLSLVLEPKMVVPIVLMLSVVSGVVLVPSVRSSTNWKSVGWVLPGVLSGAPLGVFGLMTLSLDAMRLIIGTAMIAVASILALRRIHATFGRASHVAAGLMSGVLDASSGMGGPPLIMLFEALPLTTRELRGSLVCAFLCIDALSLSLIAVGGFITDASILAFLVVMPAAFSGVYLGAKAFRSHPDSRARRLTLILTCLLGVGLILKALV